MAAQWRKIRDWPVLYLEALDEKGVARITFNRYEKRNALSVELIESCLEALEEVRSNQSIQVVITRGGGGVYSAGLDLHDLGSVTRARLADWDRPTPGTQLYETVRTFPRIMIAQIQGYCLGGAVALLNSHDLAVAASNAQIGMPEILRGSYGQSVTATLFHAGIPFKKLSLLQLGGRNLTGVEAERLGLVSEVVDEAELEAHTTTLATEIASRHPAALRHAKIAVHLGRDVPLPHALQIDRLVTARMQTEVDAFGDLDSYLESQKGGPNVSYRRPDTSQQ